MHAPHSRLSLPEEPVQIRSETRRLLEESPEEGRSLIEDGSFVADLLWREWREELEPSGMEYDRFLQVTRNYAGELRLWVVGEHPWDHCAAGLAGRVLRRLPAVQALAYEAVLVEACAG